jgi:hypothetical protein
MHPVKKKARVAGALYLLMVVIAPFGLIYVPGKLIERGNAPATSDNFLANETLFNLGILAHLIGAVVFIFLVMALYRLLAGVNENHARLMLGLVLVSVALSLVNTMSQIAAMTLFRGADFLSALDRPLRDALGMLFLHMQNKGDHVNELFWGLWLFPFGMLVYRSRFLPRILGILLIVNGVAYVAASITWLFLPAYGGIVFLVTMPALFGEIWIMLWLLIRGVNIQRLEGPLDQGSNP